jgi:hypothetical protein
MDNLVEGYAEPNKVTIKEGAKEEQRKGGSENTSTSVKR